MKAALVILIWSTQLFAFHPTGLNSSVWGEYSVLETSEYFNQKTKYLECSSESKSLLKEMIDGLIVEGTTFFPIEFIDINDSPKSVSSSIIGLTQYRSTFKDNGSDGVVFRNQHRDCRTSLLGELGCVGQKWRTTAEMKIYDDIFKTKDVVVMELMYQPFASFPPEKCVFYKE